MSSWSEPLRVVQGRKSDVVRATEDARTKLGLGSVPLLLAPPVLSAAESARIAGIVERVHTALVAVDAATRARDVVELHYPDNARALAPPNDDARPPLACCRLDALYDVDSGALSFLEVQAGDPSGPGLSDVVLAALRDAGVLAALDVHDMTTCAAHRRALMGDESARTNDDPLVVFAVPNRAQLVGDANAMAAEYRRLGTRAVRVNPKGLVMHGERAFVDLGGVRERVAAVVRDTPDDLDDEDRAALQRVLRVPGLRSLNALRDARFDDKRSFALLRHPSVIARLDEETRAALSHVPETIIVDDSTRASLARERAEWVLKPACGYGGFGIVMGVHVDDERWRTALATATSDAPAGGTVAQRAIASAPQPWPVVVDGALVVAPRYMTWSFWLHDGRATTAFVRAGEGPIVNVHQGGGIGPVLFAR